MGCYCGTNTRDHCACVCCGYPNGATQLVFAQTTLFFAMILSVASMSDCEFVVADVSPKVLPSVNNDTTVNVTELPGELGDYLDDNSRRGMGFFFFEAADGECNYDAFDADILDWYWDFLGSNWRVPRAFGSVAATVGWLLLFWSLSFACTAHPKIFRYVVAFYHIAVFGLFQFLTLLVFGSDFCVERNCELGRSAILSIVSGSFFVVSGALFFCMNDFPGPRNPIGRATSITQEEKVECKDENQDVEASAEQEIQEGPEDENANAALAHEISNHEDEEQEATLPDDEEHTEEVQRTEKSQETADESSYNAEGVADYSEEEIVEEEVSEYDIEEVTDDRESTGESESMEILEPVEEVPNESSSRGV